MSAPELEPEDNAHRCASCGRPCARCAKGEHCHRLRWCPFCAEAYTDNAPAEDGRVYCRAQTACNGNPFPPLAGLIEAGLTRYPKHCRACRERLEADRERARAERAAERELDRKIGADAVVSGAKPASDSRAVATDPRRTPLPDPPSRAPSWRGFEPRPDTPEPVTGARRNRSRDVTRIARPTAETHGALPGEYSG